MNALHCIITAGVFTVLAACADGGTAVDSVATKGEQPPLVLGLIPATPAHAHMLAPAIDFLTIRLREEPGLVMVERRELDKVLVELELSKASATAGAERRLALGALLKADLIGGFEWQGDLHRIAFRLDSMRYGARLVQAEYPFRSPQDTLAADLVLTDIRRALRKLQRAPTNAVLATLAGIRPIEPGLRPAAMAHTAEDYLRERLLAEDGLLLAIRDDLTPLQRERNIQPAISPAWARAGTLIEGDLALEGEGFRVALWIKRGAGQADDHTTIIIDPLSARAALDGAVTWITRRLLKAPPSAAGPGIEEAARLVREADRCAGDWQRQYRLLATAQILNPTDMDIVKRLLEVMAIDLHGLVLADTQRMKLDLLQEAYRHGLPPAEIFDSLTAIWSYLGSWESDASPELASRNNRLRRDCRHFAEKVYAGWQPALRGTQHEYRMLCYPCQWGTFLADTPDTALAAVETWFTNELMARVGRDGCWSQASSRALDFMLQGATAFDLHNSRFGFAIMQDMWNGFLEQLAQHADPRIRVSAEQNRLKQERDRRLPQEVRRALTRPYDPCEKLANALFEQFLSPGDREHDIMDYTACLLGMNFRPGNASEPTPSFQESALSRCPDWTILFDMRAYIAAANGTNVTTDPFSGPHFVFENFEEYVQSHLVGDRLWLRCVLRGTEEKQTVLVMRFNLSDLTQEACWSIPVERIPFSVGGGIAPGNDATYLGVANRIYVLPGAAVPGAARLEDCPMIDERAGLPAGEVTALARLGDHLYAGIGHGLLGEYDLRTRRWKTLASSESRDKACPLNMERPFRITSLTPSADGQAIFFACGQANRNSPAHEDPVDGVWNLDPGSRLISKWWHGKSFWACCAARLANQGAMMLMFTRQSIMRFDPSTGTSSVLYGAPPVSPAAAAVPPPDTSRAGPGPSPRITGMHSMVGAYRNTLWWRTDSGRAAFLCPDRSGATTHTLFCDALPPNARRIVYLCTAPQGVILITTQHIILVSGIPDTGIQETALP